MLVKDFQPSEPLMVFIARYRLRHFIFEKNATATWKPFPPRPRQCIVFYPRGKEITEYTRNGITVQRPSTVISGQFTQRINRFASHPEFLMIEVDLKPGALHYLTGVSFHEFSDRDIDGEAFFNSEIRRVNERLGSADSYPEMISIIDIFFLGLLKKQKKELLPVDLLLNSISENAENLSVDQLAKKVYLSPRQLERKFDKRIGVNPKTFLRILRFNQTYWMKLKTPGLDWLSIAVACGYNDYQHLVKDYLDFANTAPNRFFEEEKMSPGLVLGLR